MQLLQHRILGEHSQPVYALCQGLNSYSFFSGGGDRIVAAWNLDAEPLALAYTTSSIYSLFADPHSNLLWIGQMNGDVLCLRISDGQILHRYELQRGSIFDLKALDEQRIGGLSRDGFFAQFDRESGAWLQGIALPVQSARSWMPFSSNEILLVGDPSGVLKCRIDVEVALAERYSICEWPIFSITRHPNGSWVFGGKDAGLYWFNTQMQEIQPKIEAHNYAIYGLAFSPSSKYLASCSRDKTLKIWDSKDLSFQLRLGKPVIKQAHSHSVNALLWLNDQQLISVSDDRTVRCWECKD